MAFAGCDAHGNGASAVLVESVRLARRAHLRPRCGAGVRRGCRREARASGEAAVGLLAEGGKGVIGLEQNACRLANERRRRVTEDRSKTPVAGDDFALAHHEDADQCIFQQRLLLSEQRRHHLVIASALGDVAPDHHPEQPAVDDRDAIREVEPQRLAGTIGRRELDNDRMPGHRVGGHAVTHFLAQDVEDILRVTET